MPPPCCSSPARHKERIRQGHPRNGGGVFEDLGELPDAPHGAEKGVSEHTEEETSEFLRRPAADEHERRGGRYNWASNLRVQQGLSGVHTTWGCTDGLTVRLDDGSHDQPAGDACGTITPTRARSALCHRASCGSSGCPIA